MHSQRACFSVNIIIAFLLFFVQIGVCAPENGTHFDAEAATSQFEAIHHKIENMKSVNVKDIEDIQVAIHTVSQLQANAKVCEKRVQEELETFEQLTKIGDTSLLSDKEQAQYQSLEKRQQELKKEIAECRLFVFRAGDALKHYRSIALNISTTRALSRHHSIIDVIKSIPTIALQKFSLKASIDTDDLSALLQHGWLYYTLLGAFLIIILMGTKFFVDKYLSWMKLGSFIWPIVFLFMFNIVCTMEFWDRIELPNVVKIARVLLVYSIVLAAIRFFLYSKSPLIRQIGFLNRFKKTLYFRSIILFSILVLGFVIVKIFKPGAVQSELKDLALVIYLSMVVFSLGWLCWPLVTYLKTVVGKPVVAGVLEATILLTGGVLLLTTWVGYHELALLEVRGLTLTAVFASFLWVLFKLTSHIFIHLENDKFYFAKMLCKFFGVKAHKKLFELNLLKTSIYISLIYFSFVAFMFAWDFPALFIDHAVRGFFEGFNVFDVNVNFSRFITALLIFSALSLVTRLIVKSISLQSQSSIKRSRQVALASIVSYSGFAIALLVALLVAGVNFTGLAIVAGALSVGVGLGLQDIVKNFVAGIILLLEKSIKPGDRVIVGDTEGHVKKVRIRATQITTLQRSDVMVPNAEFINAQVTNYMFRSPILRIANTVGVAYGSDVEHVSELMLNIAKDHPSVINDDEHFPRVLFRSFGESHLEFELRSFIVDINRKNIIASDINFKILEAFNAHDIEIPYPKIDMYIRKNET